MSYESGMKSLRNEAIEEAKLDGHIYLVGKLYAECCTNAVGKSHYESCLDKEHAMAAAVNMTDDVDWSVTEWYENSDENVEDYDPACDRAMQDLFQHGSICVGDFRLTLDHV